MVPAPVPVLPGAWLPPAPAARPPVLAARSHVAADQLGHPVHARPGHVGHQAGRLGERLAALLGYAYVESLPEFGEGNQIERSLSFAKRLKLLTR